MGCIDLEANEVMDTAKIFRIGHSQAVCLPPAYRFQDCDEVYVRKDLQTGEVIPSRRPENLDSFLRARQQAHDAGEIPDDLTGRSRPAVI